MLGLVFYIPLATLTNSCDLVFALFIFCISCAGIYVPGVLAYSAQFTKWDVVTVEQSGQDGGWVIGMTRGTVLHGSHTGKTSSVICSGN